MVSRRSPYCRKTRSPGVDAMGDVAEIVHRAAPAAHADDVPVGLLEQEVGEVRAHHSRDACDQNPRTRHFPFLLEARNLVQEGRICHPRAVLDRQGPTRHIPPPFPGTTWIPRFSTFQASASGWPAIAAWSAQPSCADLRRAGCEILTVGRERGRPDAPGRGRALARQGTARRRRHGRRPGRRHPRQFDAAGRLPVHQPDDRRQRRERRPRAPA